MNPHMSHDWWHHETPVSHMFLILSFFLSIYHYGRVIEGIDKSLGKCPTLIRLIDSNEKRTAAMTSDGLGELGRYNVALDEPVFSAEVGVLLSCFALIEGYLPKIMSKLTGISEIESATILGHFLNVSSKINLIIDGLSNNRSSCIDNNEIDILIKMLNEAKSLRYIYGHSQYRIPYDNFVIDSFLHDAKRKPKQQTKTLDDVVNDVNTLKRALTLLHGYVYRNEPPTKNTGNAEGVSALFLSRECAL